MKAAAADPEIRSEVQSVTAVRRRGIGRLSRRLAELDSQLDVRRTDALLDALTLTEVYAKLVSVHG